MNKEHPISDEVVELVTIALSKGEHWMAYNQSLYFIDKEDVYFFKLQNKAKSLQTIIYVIGIHIKSYILIPL
jgi:hypothetical protein